MPCGRSALISAMALATLRPSARVSPPSRMAMASPMAGSPSIRNMGWGGSVKPRRTSAMSRSRSIRSPTAKVTSAMSCSDPKAPETRSAMDSLLVLKTPAGLTMFWARSAASRVLGSKPRPASRSAEKSI